MGLAVSGVGSTMNTQPVVQAQPAPVVEPVAADAIEIQELHPEAVPAAEAGTGAEQNQPRSEKEVEAENERIRKAVSSISKKLDQNTEAVFGVHEKTNRVTIKMVDKDSHKVVKEFPPDKTLDMIAKVWELAGIMVDEKG